MQLQYYIFHCAVTEMLIHNPEIGPIEHGLEASNEYRRSLMCSSPELVFHSSITILFISYPCIVHALCISRLLAYVCWKEFPAVPQNTSGDGISLPL